MGWEILSRGPAVVVHAFNPSPGEAEALYRGASGYVEPAGEKARWVKALVKPNDPSSIPGDTEMAVKNQSWFSCPLTSTHGPGRCTFPHRHFPFAFFPCP